MPDYALVWGSGLPLLVILWVVVCVIVLLETAGRRCGRAYSRVNKGEQRASILLKQWLTPEQCSEYEQRGYFEVRGSHSGKRYRIRSKRQMNVDQLDVSGNLVATLCFLPEKYVPVSDVMLAQKIALENDEPAALSVAIRH